MKERKAPSLQCYQVTTETNGMTIIPTCSVRAKLASKRDFIVPMSSQ